MLEYIPENLDFDVSFEPTRVADKKYVIDGNTGEPIAIVGKDFTCASETSMHTVGYGEPS